MSQHKLPLSLDTYDSRNSLSSNDSNESLPGQAEPLAFHAPTNDDVQLTPQSLRSSGSSSRLATTLGDLRRTLSGASSFQTAPMSRVSTRASGSYSVREIYGDMGNNDIQLRRTATRTTILDSLAQKVARSRDAYRSEDHELALEKDDDPSNFYEKLPDTSVPAKDYGGEYTTIDPELVTWDGPDDPNNPRNWPNGERMFQTFLVSLYTLISPMSSSILSPAMTEISESLGITKQVILSLCVSIMVLAWAIGPLIIAPISESDRVGRKSVLNLSIWIVAVFNLVCGFAKTPAQLCVFRFLGGLGGCASLNVGAGTLADLWNDNERQYAMAAYSLGPTLGPVLAPIISSFIVTGLDWHWCFYILAIFNFIVAAVGTVFFKETYSPRLLKLKANRLRKETGNSHLHTIYEIADGETAMEKMLVTVLRPISLIIGHPMVFGLGSFMAFTYGFMYLFIVTFPSVFKGTYGFSTNIAGLMYIPLGLGFLIGTVFWSVIIENIYNRLKAKNGGVAKPEYRLPCLCFCGIGIPVGLIWYGWSAQKHLHWIMPCIGLAIFAFSLVAVFQTIQNYLIDMNNRFAASSVAAAAVFRSSFGFSFPLFAPAMYEKLHYGWGNTMCAFIGLALGLPFPLFCLAYGERLRNWANRRFDKKQAERDQRNLERLKKINEKEYMRRVGENGTLELGDRDSELERRDSKLDERNVSELERRDKESA